MNTKEFIINIWSLIYSNKNGAKYSGKLTVTNKRLLYDAPFDGKSKELIDTSLLQNWNEKQYLIIDKERIQAIRFEKKVLANKAIITLDNGSEHIFNYGILNIFPIIEAIQTKRKADN